MMDDTNQPLEQLLCNGPGIAFDNRIRLALSVAGAFWELETDMQGQKASGFHLDGVLCDTRQYTVSLNREILLNPEGEAEERKKLLRLGLLPPEACQSEEAPFTTPEALRHILAVLVFRCLTNADPFDGLDTYCRYPNRSEKNLLKIYGRDAMYVYGEQSKNPTTQWIGSRVNAVMQMLGPDLRGIFETAFCEGIAREQLRPTAAQWLSSQKKLLCRAAEIQLGRQIPDPDAGARLITRHGMKIALTEGRQLVQCMLEPELSPADMTPVGTVRITGGKAFLETESGRQPLDALGTVEGLGLKVQQR